MLHKRLELEEAPGFYHLRLHHRRIDSIMIIIMVKTDPGGEPSHSLNRTVVPEEPSVLDELGMRT